MPPQGAPEPVAERATRNLRMSEHPARIVGAVAVGAGSAVGSVVLPGPRIGFPRIIILSLYWVALGYLWLPLGSQVIPQIILDLGLGAHKGTLVFVLEGGGTLLSIFVQPIVGALSDRTNSRFGRRHPYILLGTLGSCVFLSLMILAGSFFWLMGLYFLLQLSENSAQGPYQGLLPDVVPEEERSRASAFVGGGNRDHHARQGEAGSGSQNRLQGSARWHLCHQPEEVLQLSLADDITAVHPGCLRRAAELCPLLLPRRLLPRPRRGPRQRRPGGHPRPLRGDHPARFAGQLPGRGHLAPPRAQAADHLRRAHRRGRGSRSDPFGLSLPAWLHAGPGGQPAAPLRQPQPIALLRHAGGDRRRHLPLCRLGLPVRGHPNGRGRSLPWLQQPCHRRIGGHRENGWRATDRHLQCQRPHPRAARRLPGNLQRVHGFLPAGDAGDPQGGGD